MADPRSPDQSELSELEEYKRRQERERISEGWLDAADARYYHEADADADADMDTDADVDTDTDTDADMDVEATGPIEDPVGLLMSTFDTGTDTRSRPIGGRGYESSDPAFQEQQRALYVSLLESTAEEIYNRGDTEELTRDEALDASRKAMQRFAIAGSEGIPDLLIEADNAAGTPADTPTLRAVRVFGRQIRPTSPLDDQQATRREKARQYSSDDDGIAAGLREDWEEALAPGAGLNDQITEQVGAVDAYDTEGRRRAGWLEQYDREKKALESERGAVVYQLRHGQGDPDALSKQLERIDGDLAALYWEERVDLNEKETAAGQIAGAAWNTVEAGIGELLATPGRMYDLAFGDEDAREQVAQDFYAGEQRTREEYGPTLGEALEHRGAAALEELKHVLDPVEVERLTLAGDIRMDRGDMEGSGVMLPRGGVELFRLAESATPIGTVTDWHAKKRAEIWEREGREDPEFAARYGSMPLNADELEELAGLRQAGTIRTSFDMLLPALEATRTTEEAAEQLSALSWSELPLPLRGTLPATEDTPEALDRLKRTPIRDLPLTMMERDLMVNADQLETTIRRRKEAGARTGAGALGVFEGAMEQAMYDSSRDGMVRRKAMTTPGWLLNVPASIATEVFLEQDIGTHDIPLLGGQIDALANASVEGASRDDASLVTHGAHWVLTGLRDARMPTAAGIDYMLASEAPAYQMIRDALGIYNYTPIRDFDTGTWARVMANIETGAPGLHGHGSEVLLESGVEEDSAVFKAGNALFNAGDFLFDWEKYVFGLPVKGVSRTARAGWAARHLPSGARLQAALAGFSPSLYAGGVKAGYALDYATGVDARKAGDRMKDEGLEHRDLPSAMNHLVRQYGRSDWAKGKNPYNQLDAGTKQAVREVLATVGMDPDDILARGDELAQAQLGRTLSATREVLRRDTPDDQALRSSSGYRKFEASVRDAVTKGRIKGKNTPTIMGLYETLAHVHSPDNPAAFFDRLDLVISDDSPLAPPPGELASGGAGPAFYSAVTRAADRAFGSADRMKARTVLNRLYKQPGVKRAEVEWMGLDEYLTEKATTGDGRVTRQELKDYIGENVVELEEVTYKGDQQAYLQTERAIVANESEIRKAKFLRDSALKRGSEQGAAHMDNILQQLEDRGAQLRAQLDSIKAPKYSEYTFGGGENYREVLLRMPGREQGGYRGEHWDEPDVLAHLRLQDHIGPDGTKTLIVEELQSDLHQAGRKAGYTDRNADARRRAAVRREIDQEYTPKQTTDDRGRTLYRLEWNDGDGSAFLGENFESIERAYEIVIDGRLDEAEGLEVSEALNEGRLPKKPVPDAPFKKSWHSLGLKRVLREAAVGGYDRIAWPQGADVAERFGKGTRYDAVEWESRPNQPPRLVLWRDGLWVDIDMPEMQRPEDAAAAIGEANAAELAEQVRRSQYGSAKISVEPAEYNVAGFQQFYDGTIRNTLAKLTSKYRAKFGQMDLPGEDVKVHTLTVTPKMRRAALEGYPLFQKTGDRVAGSFTVEESVRPSTPSDVRDFLAAAWKQTKPRESSRITRKRVERLSRQILIPTKDLEGMSKAALQMEAERILTVAATTLRRVPGTWEDLPAPLGKHSRAAAINAAMRKWVKFERAIMRYGWRRTLKPGQNPDSLLPAVLEKFASDNGVSLKGIINADRWQKYSVTDEVGHVWNYKYNPKRGIEDLSDAEVLALARDIVHETMKMESFAGVPAALAVPVHGMTWRKAQARYFRLTAKRAPTVRDIRALIKDLGLKVTDELVLEAKDATGYTTRDTKLKDVKKDQLDKLAQNLIKKAKADAAGWTPQKGTTPENAGSSFKQIDAIKAEADGKALTSEAAWTRAMARLFGEDMVLAPPTRAMELAEDPSLITAMLDSMSEGQHEAAREGMALADEFREAYASGDMTATDTGLLFFWGILSRQLSPYPHEAGFLDGVIEGVEAHIEAALEGRFDEKAYLAWAASVKAQQQRVKSPGIGAIANLKDFGRIFLKKMSEQKPGTGGTYLQHLHELMADQTLSGPQVRRAFFEQLPAKLGINAKVVSFVILVTGRKDVIVLDRVQIRHLWDNAGQVLRYGTTNIYNGYGKTGDHIKKEISAYNPWTSSAGMAGIVMDARGLGIYELLEEGLKDAVAEGYQASEKATGEGSLGRFHWESWVAQSAQEVSHGSLEGLLRNARNLPDPWKGAAVREGKYSTTASGFEYVIGASGSRHFVITTSSQRIQMDSAAMLDYLTGLTGYIAKINKESPDGFQVSDHTTRPWYEHDLVDRAALDDLAERVLATHPQAARALPAQPADQTSDPGGRGERTHDAGGLIESVVRSALRDDTVDLTPTAEQREAFNEYRGENPRLTDEEVLGDLKDADSFKALPSSHIERMRDLLRSGDPAQVAQVQELILAIGDPDYQSIFDLFNPKQVEILIEKAARGLVLWAGSTVADHQLAAKYVDRNGKVRPGVSRSDALREFGRHHVAESRAAKAGGVYGSQTRAAGIDNGAADALFFAGHAAELIEQAPVTADALEDALVPALEGIGMTRAELGKDLAEGQFTVSHDGEGVMVDLMQPWRARAEAAIAQALEFADFDGSQFVDAEPDGPAYVFVEPRNLSDASYGLPALARHINRAGRTGLETSLAGKWKPEVEAQLQAEAGDGLTDEAFKAIDPALKSRLGDLISKGDSSLIRQARELIKGFADPDDPDLLALVEPPVQAFLIEEAAKGWISGGLPLETQREMLKWLTPEGTLRPDVSSRDALINLTRAAYAGDENRLLLSSRGETLAVMALAAEAEGYPVFVEEVIKEAERLLQAAGYEVISSKAGKYSRAELTVKPARGKSPDPDQLEDMLEKINPYSGDLVSVETGGKDGRIDIRVPSTFSEDSLNMGASDIRDALQVAKRHLEHAARYPTDTVVTRRRQRLAQWDPEIIEEIEAGKLSESSFRAGGTKYSDEELERLLEQYEAGEITAEELRALFDEGEGKGEPKPPTVAEKMDTMRAELDALTEQLQREYHLDRAWVFVRKNEAGEPALVIDQLRVLEEYRRQGLGTRALEDLLDYADAHGAPVATTPEDMGTPKAALTRWLKANGFKPNKGSQRDHVLRETMIRPAQAEVTQRSRPAVKVAPVQPAYKTNPPAPRTPLPRRMPAAAKAFIADSAVQNIVYHGAPDLRWAQDPETAAFIGAGGRKPEVIFFTDDKRIASTYRDSKPAFHGQEAEGGILEGYLSIKNPKRIDWGGEVWSRVDGDGVKLHEHIDRAKAAGHDGVIVENVVDDYQRTSKSRRGTVYVVFESSQFKSRKNRGTYDPGEDSILKAPTFEEYRAGLQLDEAQLNDGDRENLAAIEAHAATDETFIPWLMRHELAERNAWNQSLEQLRAVQEAQAWFKAPEDWQVYQDGAGRWRAMDGNGEPVGIHLRGGEVKVDPSGYVLPGQVWSAMFGDERVGGFNTRAEAEDNAAKVALYRGDLGRTVDPDDRDPVRVGPIIQGMTPDEVRAAIAGAPTEHLAVFIDGVQIIRATGDVDQVPVTARQKARILKRSKGSEVRAIHNHPGEARTVLSSEDVILGARLNATHIEALSGPFYAEMEAPPDHFNTLKISHDLETLKHGENVGGFEVGMQLSEMVAFSRAREKANEIRRTERREPTFAEKMEIFVPLQLKELNDGLDKFAPGARITEGRRSARRPLQPPAGGVPEGRAESGRGAAKSRRAGEGRPLDREEAPGAGAPERLRHPNDTVAMIKDLLNGTPEDAAYGLELVLQALEVRPMLVGLIAEDLFADLLDTHRFRYSDRDNPNRAYEQMMEFGAALSNPATHIPPAAAPFLDGVLADILDRGAEFFQDHVINDINLVRSFGDADALLQSFVGLAQARARLHGRVNQTGAALEASLAALSARWPVTLTLEGDTIKASGGTAQADATTRLDTVGDPRFLQELAEILPTVDLVEIGFQGEIDMTNLIEGAGAPDALHAPEPPAAGIERDKYGRVKKPAALDFPAGSGEAGAWNVVSLFDGISAGRQAIKNIGLPVDRYVASEIETKAMQVAKKNHPDIEHIGDVEQVTRDMLPGDVDLFIGGSPCQDLRKGREGLKGKQSRLFYEYTRLLEESGATYFLFENTGEISAEDLAIVNEQLGVEPVMIDAGLLSGQSRRRYFWTNIPGVTQPADLGIRGHEVMLSYEEASKLPPSQVGRITEKTRAYMEKRNKNRTAPRWMSGQNSIQIDTSDHARKIPTLYRIRGKGAPYDIVTHDMKQWRRLAVVEGERLQGFPDGYTDGISRQQALFGLGNSWSVPTVEHILSHLSTEATILETPPEGVGERASRAMLGEQLSLLTEAATTSPNPEGIVPGKFRKRDYEVRRLTKAQRDKARDFLVAHHYNKRPIGDTFSYIFGLYRHGSDELLGVTWWKSASSPAVRQRILKDWEIRRPGETANVPLSDTEQAGESSVLQLSRMAVHPDLPRGAAGFLSRRGLAQVRADNQARRKAGKKPFRTAVTYADRRHDHHGGVYQATGWIYSGHGKPDVAWIDEQGGEVPRKSFKTRTRTEMDAEFERLPADIKYRYTTPIDRGLVYVGEDLEPPRSTPDGDLDDGAMKAPGDGKVGTFEPGETPGTLIGYRVMDWDPSSRRAVSQADRRQSYEPVVGEVQGLTGLGMFLASRPEYVVDYYAAGEHNVILKYEFDPYEVTSGSLTDREPEITVRGAKLLDFEVFGEEEAPTRITSSSQALGDLEDGKMKAPTAVDSESPALPATLKKKDGKVAGTFREDGDRYKITLYQLGDEDVLYHETGHLIEALADPADYALWTEHFDSENGKLTRQGQEDYAEAYRYFLKTRLSPNPRLTASFHAIYGRMRDFWMRRRSAVTSGADIPAEVIARWDADYRPNEAAEDVALQMPDTARPKTQFDLVEVPESEHERTTKNPMRERGHTAEEGRIDLRRQNVMQALGLRDGETARVTDLITNAIAYTYTEKSRKWFGEGKLARLTVRTAVPAGRVKAIQQEATATLERALGDSIKQVARQTTEDGNMHLTPGQAAGLQSLALQLANEPLGDILPEWMITTPTLERWQAITLQEYNAILEVLIDTRAGVGARRSRSAEGVPPTVGYAMLGVLTQAPEAMHHTLGIEGGLELKEAWVENLTTISPSDDVIDPGVQEIIDSGLRQLQEAPTDIYRWITNLDTKTIRESLRACGSMLKPPVNVVHLPYLSRSLGLLGDGDLPAHLSHLLTVERLTELDTVLSQGSAKMLPAEVEAMRQLWRLQMNPGLLSKPGANDVLAQATTVLRNGLQRRQKLIAQRAEIIAQALVGKKQASRVQNLDIAELREVYRMFYAGDWSHLETEKKGPGAGGRERTSLSGWASTKGLETGYEVTRTPSVDPNTALLEMIVRLRALEIMDTLSEQLAVYGLTGKPGEDLIGQAPGPFLERVKHYINLELTGGALIQTTPGGDVIHRPPPPDRVHDFMAYNRARDLLEQWGFNRAKLEQADWVVYTFPDGSQAVIPPSVKEEIDAAVERVGRVGTAASRTDEAFGLDLGDRLGTPERLKELGYAKRAAYGIGAAVNNLWRLFPALGSAIRQGITVGPLLPNPAYFGANFIGAAMQVYQTVGMGRTLAIGLRHPVVTGAVVKRLYDRGRWRDAPRADHKAATIVTKDGRIYSADQLADLAISQGLDSSAIQAESAQSLARDIAHLHKPTWRKLMSMPALWQDLLIETATVMDNYWRVGTMIDALKRGESPTAAAQLARDTGYDYGALSDFEKKYCRFFVMFYSYMKRNQVHFWDTLLTNPSRILGQMRLMRGLSDSLLGDDDDQIMPEFYEPRLLFAAKEAAVETHRRSGVGYLMPPLPIADGYLLWADLYDLAASGINTQHFDEKAARGIAGRATPWVQAGPVMVFGADLFFGKDLEEFQDVPPSYIALDYHLTGGILTKSVFDVQPVPVDDPSRWYNDSNDMAYTAKNARVWWAFRNLGAFIPGGGRNMDTIDAMNRSGISLRLVDHADQLRQAGYTLAPEEIVPRERWVADLLNTSAEEFRTPRYGMTQTDEALRLWGIKSIHLGHPDAHRDMLERDASMRMTERMMDLEAP